MFLKASLYLLVVAFMCVRGEVVYKKSNVAEGFIKDGGRGRQCTEQGVMCDDCHTLVFCSKNEDGEWVKELAQNCDSNGRTCSTETTPHSCSTSTTDECDPRLLNYTLECHKIGLFPHPFDCTKYFNCHTDSDGVIVKKPISFQCKEGYGYDSLTALCRIPLSGGECEGRLMDRCYTAGRIDPIPGNPYLYSVCLTTDAEGSHKFFPQFFHCTANEVFVDNACVQIQTGLNSDGRCSGIGFFYDPQDCKKYKQCTLGGTSPLTMSCLFGYEFDPIARTCVVLGDKIKSYAVERECTEQGFLCHDCYTIVFCRKNDDGEWVKEPASECNFGQFCTMETNPPSCSFGQNDECEPSVINYELDCHQPGLFPHPFNCKRYFNCIADEDGVLNPKPLQYECKNGFAYDSLTTLCRKTLNEEDCYKRLIEPCWSPGRTQAVEGNPYLYSVCLDEQSNGRNLRFAQMFYCNGDDQFVNGECTQIETGLNENGKCIRTGFFKYPANCKRYRECLLSGLSPTTRSCAFGYEFDPISKICVSFKCK